MAYYRPNGSMGSRLRVYQGVSAQGLSQAAQIIIRLVEVPLFLKIWGVALYGEWLMLAAIPVYFMVGDVGFTGAAGRQMCMLSSGGNDDGALSVYQSTWALLLAISAAIAMIAGALIIFLPLTNWLGFTHISQGELHVVLLLLITHVLIGFQSRLIYGGFWCSGHYPLGIFLMTMTQILEFACLVFALTNGGGPVHAAGGYLCGQILGTIGSVLVLQYVNPILRFGFANASGATLKNLLYPAVTSIAFPLGNIFNIQSIRLIVGIVLGPSAVAIFTPMRTLSRFATQPRVIVNHIVTPELALAFGAGDDDLFRRLVTKSCQITFWTTLSIIPVIVFVSYSLFPYWTDGQLNFHWPLYLTLLSTIIINALWYTALMAPYATNRYTAIAIKYAVIYGFGALLLGYLGALTLGLVGVAIALLVVEMSMAVLVIPAAIQISDLRLMAWLKTVANPPFFLIEEGLGAIHKVLNYRTNTRDR